MGPGALSSKDVTVTKGHDNEVHWACDINEPAVIKNMLDSSELASSELGNLRAPTSFEEIFSELESVEGPSPALSAFLDKLNQLFPERNTSAGIVHILGERLPKFLYFSDYYLMPGQVSIDDLLRRQADNQLENPDNVFIALLDLVGTTPEEIQRMEKFEALIAELEAVSNRLSQEIFQYWSQNLHLEVDFLFDHALPGDPPPFNSGYIFRTRIKNTRHGVTVSFDERSAGFVWFFSFLVWFSQVKRNYDENLIILLDDPALNLHAKAQSDLLRYVDEKLKPDHQVIYTTHSPFMIDPDNLIKVRTIEDVVVDDEIHGTKVGDEVLSTDSDTLFPLQAALGYDITQTLFIGEHTLLVEGPSDLLYLRWFSNGLKSRDREHLDPSWVISPCGGIGKVASFVTLFGANKLHVAVFTDFHTGVKQKVRDLRDSELLRKGHVFSADMYVKEDEADIEDLLGRALYVALVNECYGLTDTHKLPTQKPQEAPTRVVEEVEAHFRTLPPEVPEFDHTSPALFLMEHGGQLRSSLPYLERSLKKFEQLFLDLNNLLSQ